MASHASGERAIDGGWSTIASLLASDGSAAHPFVAILSAPRVAIRDLADAIHCICILHGRHPGVLDIVAERATSPETSAWMAEAAEAFVEERAWLGRLVSAAGPIPSTPGQAETEATIIAQCHALAMLARSERVGCAAGAGIAVGLDWHSVRLVLDRASERLGVASLPSRLPSLANSERAFAASDIPAPTQRAMAFGAQQVLAQHRGLWNLLHARADARLSL